MFHTFHYRDGCYIHVAVDPDTKRERIEWQDANRRQFGGEVASVRGAKSAITRHINRMNAPE